MPSESRKSSSSDIAFLYDLFLEVKSELHVSVSLKEKKEPPSAKVVEVRYLCVTDYLHARLNHELLEAILHVGWQGREVLAFEKEECHFLNSSLLTAFLFGLDHCIVPGLGCFYLEAHFILRIEQVLTVNTLFFDVKPVHFQLVVLCLSVLSDKNSEFAFHPEAMLDSVMRLEAPFLKFGLRSLSARFVHFLQDLACDCTLRRVQDATSTLL